MSELEIVTLSLSLILGLSMAQMLSTVALSIRSRHESRIHWVPVACAAAIFFYHVQFWFALVEVDRAIVAWSWDWFGPILMMAVLLFLSGALVLPSAGRPLPTDLIGDFEFAPAFRFGGLPQDQAESSMRLFAADVLPVLKSWS